MVRFHWHVEDGFSAYIPPGGITAQPGCSVLHANCEIEFPGMAQGQTAQACMSMPANYLTDGRVRPTGLILGHGLNAADWQGKMLTDMAVTLARAGFLVMRYHCAHKEQRRLKIFEKALDACATSPFGRSVEQWVLAGFGNGARVAATVGTRCRGTMAGFAFLSYPLLESVPATKGAAMDSAQPLLKLTAPMLFILGAHDSMCSMSDLQKLRGQLLSKDVRTVLIPDVDGGFRAHGAKGPVQSVLKQLSMLLLEYCYALDTDRLEAVRGTSLEVRPASGAKQDDLSQDASDMFDGEEEEDDGAFSPSTHSAEEQARRELHEAMADERDFDADMEEGAEEDELAPGQMQCSSAQNHIHHSSPLSPTLDLPPPRAPPASRKAAASKGPAINVATPKGKPQLPAAKGPTAPKEPRKPRTPKAAKALSPAGNHAPPMTGEQQPREQPQVVGSKRPLSPIAAPVEKAVNADRTVAAGTTAAIAAGHPGHSPSSSPRLPVAAKHMFPHKAVPQIPLPVESMPATAQHGALLEKNRQRAVATAPTTSSMEPPPKVPCIASSTPIPVLALSEAPTGPTGVPQPTLLPPVSYSLLPQQRKIPDAARPVTAVGAMRPPYGVSTAQQGLELPSMCAVNDPAALSVQAGMHGHALLSTASVHAIPSTASTAPPSHSAASLAFSQSSAPAAGSMHSTPVMIPSAPPGMHPALVHMTIPSMQGTPMNITPLHGAAMNIAQVHGVPVPLHSAPTVMLSAMRGSNYPPMPGAPQSSTPTIMLPGLVPAHTAHTPHSPVKGGPIPVMSAPVPVMSAPIPMMSAPASFHGVPYPMHMSQHMMHPAPALQSVPMPHSAPMLQPAAAVAAAANPAVGVPTQQSSTQARWQQPHASSRMLPSRTITAVNAAPAHTAPAHTAPAHAAPAESAAAHSGTARVAAAHTSVCHSLTGCTPAGLTSAAYTPAAHTSAGHSSAAYTPAAHTLAGLTPTVYIPVSHTSVGHAPAGLTPAAYTPAGHSSAGRVAAGLTPAAYTPAGRTPATHPSASQGAVGHSPGSHPIPPASAAPAALNTSALQGACSGPNIAKTAPDSTHSSATPQALAAAAHPPTTAAHAPTTAAHPTVAVAHPSTTVARSTITVALPTTTAAHPIAASLATDTSSVMTHPSGPTHSAPILLHPSHIFHAPSVPTQQAMPPLQLVRSESTAAAARFMPSAPHSAAPTRPTQLAPSSAATSPKPIMCSNATLPVSMYTPASLGPKPLSPGPLPTVRNPAAMSAPMLIPPVSKPPSMAVHASPAAGLNALVCMPSATSLPPLPSLPALPSLPSMPLMVSMASMPAMPSLPSMPAMPSLLTVSNAVAAKGVPAGSLRAPLASVPKDGVSGAAAVGGFSAGGMLRPAVSFLPPDRSGNGSGPPGPFPSGSLPSWGPVWSYPAHSLADANPAVPMPAMSVARHMPPGYSAGPPSQPPQPGPGGSCG